MTAEETYYMTAKDVKRDLLYDRKRDLPEETYH